MEPRFFERGNYGTIIGATWVPLVASMEPRFFERGN